MCARIRIDNLPSISPEDRIPPPPKILSHRRKKPFRGRPANRASPGRLPFEQKPRSSRSLRNCAGMIRARVSANPDRRVFKRAKLQSLNSQLQTLNQRVRASSGRLSRCKKSAPSKPSFRPSAACRSFRRLPSPAPAPTINVTIGRVEIRATSPAPPPQRARPKSANVLSLEDYLRQRAKGGGR